MPRNKVLERAKVSAPTGRNEFDLSRIGNFTAMAGYQQVVLAQPVPAGTHGRLNRTVFTRSADVVAPAFPQVTQHVDFFIVNLKSLWSYWENWKLNINDLKSSQLVAFDTQAGSGPILSLADYVPTFDFGAKHGQTTIPVYATERVFPDLTGTPTQGQRDKLATDRNNMIRLLDQCGFGRILSAKNGLTAESNVLNLFKLAAYQKIYFEHYRNTAYESNNPYAYNLDWVTQNGLSQVGGIIDPTTSTGLHVIQQLCTLRKVNYRNDYFHNIYPSLNYVNSLPNGSTLSVPSNLAGFLNQEFVRPAASTDSVYQSKQVVSISGVNYSQISVQAIRAAFALDKLMRASAYAPKHVKEQFKAQFGVEIPDDDDMCSHRLGSFQNDVTFQEVTQMAPGTFGNLGDLGAKGVGRSVGSKDIEFYAQYDSLIIGIQYFMPRAIYDSDGIDIWNVGRVRGDFYSKFFENLGLRPLYVKELDNATVGFPQNPNLTPNSVIGFTVPNQILKLGIDKNYGEFKKNFDSYVSDTSGTGATLVQADSSYLRNFTIHTFAPSATMDVNGNLNAGYFKVNPEDLDYIFRVATPGDHGLGTFQFYGQIYIKLLTSSPMGVHGQPSL